MMCLMNQLSVQNCLDCFVNKNDVERTVCGVRVPYLPTGLLKFSNYLYPPLKSPECGWVNTFFLWKYGSFVNEIIVFCFQVARTYFRFFHSALCLKKRKQQQNYFLIFWRELIFPAAILCIVYNAGQCREHYLRN